MTLVAHGLVYTRPVRGKKVQALPGDQPEPQFMRDVIKQLKLFGWDLIYHAYDSTNSVAGFPDIIALRRDRGLALECKGQHGRTRPGQAEWIAGFNAIPGFHAAIVRPSDWPWILKEAA